MNTAADFPNGLKPIDKTQSFADIKASHAQFQYRGEAIEERHELMSDTVQFTQKTEFSQSEMMHQLTADRNLNEYINMLKQVAELEENTLKDTSLKPNQRGQSGIPPNQMLDFLA